jgi:hypothetical protein
MQRRLPLLCLLFATALPLFAQEAATATKKLRVHVIGASVSGGFRDGPLFGAKEQGDSVTLQQVVKAWAGDTARVTTHSTTQMTGMFTDPIGIGTEEVQQALRSKPDIVLAIDFPFWFAYGFVSGNEAKARKEKLAEGLAMLAKFSVPVLLGDLPDMHGAARRMLNPRQIPSKELLAELNVQLAAFCKEHTNMHLMPLSKLVSTMRDEGVVLPLADGALKTGPGALQQEDRLHATRLGMAYLGYVLQEPMRELFPKDHALHARDWKFEQFVEAAGADGDLEQAEAAAKNAKAGEKPAVVGK